MWFCDISTVDWNAISAVGTWVVGGAAIWVAFKANAIAHNLHAAEAERERRAAEAMVIGLRIETIHYGTRIKRLAARLNELVDHGSNLAMHAAVAFEAIERIEVSDLGHRTALLPNLPADLSKQISFLWADVKAARSTFANNATFMREALNLKVGDSDLAQNLRMSSQELHRMASRTFDVVYGMTAFLGMPPDKNYMEG